MNKIDTRSLIRSADGFWYTMRTAPKGLFTLVNVDTAVNMASSIRIVDRGAPAVEFESADGKHKVRFYYHGQQDTTGCGNCSTCSCK